MDSANSGSIQSSSAGDDEYESRAGNSSAMIDPFSSFFNPSSTTSSSLPLTNPLLNLDMVQSRTMSRSNQFPTNFTGNQTSSFSGSQSTAPAPETNQNPPRNPKKRPRASRRAPTTVLTTDTSNFRAMVQEFTGIPSPPFPTTSPFPRNNRFDLFGTIRSTNFDVSLRPFAQKHHFLSPPSSSQSLLNLQNPVFNIQNMFLSAQGASEIQQNVDQSVKMGSFEGFGLNQRLAGEEEVLPPETRVSDRNLSSEFVGEKAVENVRSEGMLESWICSSD